MQVDASESVGVRVLPGNRVTREDAARIFDRSTKTMAMWKGCGWGPRPMKVGSRVFYDYSECLAMARGEKPVNPAEAA